MEIVGIGTDIVECLRIGRMIEAHGELFLARVYTEREVRYCQGRKRAVEHFAGRWAAKDVAQALRIADILISISHCRAYATAYAIALSNGAQPPAAAAPGDPR